MSASRERFITRVPGGPTQVEYLLTFLPCALDAAPHP